MTIYELTERDLRKAKLNLFHAQAKPNVTASELENLEESVKLRTEIFERVRRDHLGTDEAN